MAYINPNILQEDWNALGTWIDNPNDGGVSEIDPAGQLHLDCLTMTGNGFAERNKDFGTIGTGDYWVEIRFIGDAWGGYVSQTWGFFNIVNEYGKVRISFLNFLL